MDLVTMLTSQLGINEDQAAGGAGLLFKMAKEKLGDGDFSKIANAVPDVANLIGKAPESDSSGGLMGAIGGIASALGAEKLGGLANLASGFSKLNLDESMISNFIPIILNFVKDKAGDEVMGLLSKVFD